MPNDSHTDPHDEDDDFIYDGPHDGSYVNRPIAPRRDSKKWADFFNLEKSPLIESGILPFIGLGLFMLLIVLVFLACLLFYIWALFS